MKARERYLETLLFGTPDRIPLDPGAPRESTLAAWHQQGLSQGIAYLDALSKTLGLPREAFDTAVYLPRCFRMIPTFKEEVLEHRNGHYLVRDWMGAITEISDAYDYTYIRSAKDFVTRKWHQFPVRNREDWEKMTRRYDPHDATRFSEDFADHCKAMERSGMAVALVFNGPFWQMREWTGMECLCSMMIEQPVFVEEMAGFWQDFALETLEIVLRQVQVDAVVISEDMAYKAHSMISPAMARRFLQPTYRKWNDLLRTHGCAVLDMDSDGYVEELIPIWIESGFNCCNPIEVAAGNDLVAFRRRFGRQMAYRGGIDKRAIAAGGATMREEVMRVTLPLLEEGGYLPSCDHGVPPDISWAHYVEYTHLLAELTCWL